MTIVNGYEIKPFANLRGADLRGADLRGANLKEANLQGADLKGANLRGANLQGADLKGANLRGANLRGADLYGAYLYGADLRGANLKGANLRGANLRSADLYGADLEGADLRGTDLKGAVIPNFLICPQEGSFIAYKKTTKGVVKLIILEDALRTNSLVGRKCRASKVIVIGGEGVGGEGPNYGGITYNEGETITCEDYDPDIRVECTRGIHFFMTEKEAKEW